MMFREMPVFYSRYQAYDDRYFTGPLFCYLESRPLVIKLLHLKEVKTLNNLAYQVNRDLSLPSARAPIQSL
jgi:hypothetical protein